MMLVLIISLTNHMATAIFIPRKGTVPKIREAEVVGVGTERASSAVTRDIWQEIVLNQEEAGEDSIMAEEGHQVEEEIGTEEVEDVFTMVVEVEISVVVVEEVDAGELTEEADTKLQLPYWLKCAYYQ